MTRRILALLVALALLTGCADSPDQGESPQTSDAAQEESEQAEGDLEALAQTAVEALAAGDPEPLHSMFAPAVAAQLTQDGLLDAWAQTILPAGEYVGTADVNTQDVQGLIGVNVVSEFTGTNVVASITMDDDGAVHGVWFSYAEAEASEHPDPPTLPDGATEVEITVGEYELPGLLTLPASDGPNAVVLLVAGSGPNDMDGSYGSAGNAVLRDLAYQLAGHGVPTLRYDKRFHVAPESASAAVTIRDEVLDDVDAAIALLAETEEVAGRAIIVAGHSLGGMLIPAIVAENSEVAGVVSLAGTLRTLWDVVADQNEAAIEAALASGAMTEDAAEEARETLAEEIARANTLTDPSAPAIADVFAAPYVVSLNELGLDQLAAELEIPILVLQGSGDFQVLAGADFESWEPALAEHPDATFRMFDGLNHFFMPEVTAGDMTDYETPSAVDPEVTGVIAEWLRERW